MALRARPREAAAISRPYAPERFEYRIWGRAFAELPTPDDVAPSVEFDLMSEQGGVNAKLRGGAGLKANPDGYHRAFPGREHVSQLACQETPILPIQVHLHFLALA